MTKRLRFQMSAKAEIMPAATALK